MLDDCGESGAAPEIKPDVLAGEEWDAKQRCHWEVEANGSSPPAPKVGEEIEVGDGSCGRQSPGTKGGKRRRSRNVCV